MQLQPAPTLRATNGMVCAIDHLAAQAGLEMLRAGGNAADAAIATSAVLAVTSQHLCGMGGDLLAVVAPPGSDPVALNSSGRAGSGADPQRLRAAGHTVMPFRDHISVVTVPGCVDGWLALHERFAELELAELLEPARRYAEEGFPASPVLVNAFEVVKHLPDAADYLASAPLRPGTIIRRPGVARTLAAIAAGGRDAFYGGEFGAGLLELGAGEFVADDFARPLADWTTPLSTDAFGKRLWTVPPNSSGYLTLAGAAIADGLAFPDDHTSAEAAFLLVEAARQAGHDRPAVLYEGADVGWLLAPDEIGRRRSAIDPAKAAVLGDGYRPGGTIALVAVDRNHLGISVLQSNASGFGSHLIEPHTRIFLHNRGIGFSLSPGHPDEYGPRRRPASTLCPTAVTNPDGTLAGVLGSMGGDSQPQVLLQLLHRWLVGGEDPGDAVAAGRWVLQDPAGGGSFATWNQGGHVHIALEANVPPSWASGLRARGHEVDEAPPEAGSFGNAHLIAIDGEVLAGGTDPRPRFGAVAAY